MKRLIQQVPRLAVFLLLPFSFFLITACPDPPETTDCGAHQIEVNGNCECEEGYHWNEDETKCLMDTTSHAFTWHYDPPIGAPLASGWNDVSIIDENDIWVVGYIEIDEYDSSTGLNYSRYNASYWNGNEWTLKKIMVLRVLFPEQGEGIHYDSSGQEIKSIFRINSDLLFMTHGGQHAYFRNDEWIYYENQYWSFYYSVICMWGTSFNNMYFPGNFGRVVYYNGSSYEFYQVSEKDIPFVDIWGLDNSHIWIVGFDDTHNDSQILFYDGSTWREKYHLDFSDWWPNDLNPDTLDGTVQSVWAWGDTVYFGTWHGVWKESVTSHKGSMISFEDMGVELFWIRKIRGNGYNDVFVVGNKGETLHFNGNNWRMIQEKNPSYEIWSIDVKNDMIVLAGHDSNLKSLTVRGYR